MLQIGSVIDEKYKILNKIGQGGMSVVYLAMNERANKQWAIKEVRKDGVQNFEVVKQSLVAETDMLKKLNHPNLPSIIDVIDGEGSFLIVMDYIEGNPLSRALKEYGAQPQEDVIEWAKQLCDVLGYLHSRKPAIIYRDMKPSNVMLKPDGTVNLIDFGTAREFKEDRVEDTKCLGTQGYAAPEQYGGHGQTDARTDIYCLGATLYHLLTGHNPSQPPYEMYPIRQWNPGLSSGLEEIILKCTQKNPADRYQNCAELMYALEHYTELDAEFKRTQKRKMSAFIAAASLTLVMAVGATGFRVAESNVTAQTYDSYISAASENETLDSEKSIDYYRNAINLNPSKIDGYEKLLNYFMYNTEEGYENGETKFCVFSAEEEVIIREILAYTGDSNRSNEEYLKSNEDAYCKFAYDLGIAYYYSYEGSGNKQLASKWLGVAKDAQESKLLKESEIARAENLCTISEYYGQLGTLNQAGDSQVSYDEYWMDLVKIAQADAESNNTVYMLLSYKELTSQIQNNANKFASASVTEQQMRTQLDTIEKDMNSLKINSSDANREYEENLKETVTSNIRLARIKLDSVFNNDTGGDTNGTDSIDD